MSKVNIEQHVCSHCGKSYDIRIWESINVDLNPEMREKVLSGKLFQYECPHCHEIEEIKYPFLYHDMSHSFMIFVNNFGDLFEIYEDAVKKGPFQLLSLVGKTMTFRGVVRYDDLITKIVALESGLDDRIVELVKISEANQYIRLHKNPSDKPFKIDSIVLKYVTKENGLGWHWKIEEEGELKEFYIMFNNEKYDDMKCLYSAALDGIYEFYFDRNSAIKLRSYLENEREPAKKKKIKIAIIGTLGDAKLVGVIPEDKINEIHEKTPIVLNYPDGDQALGMIIRIIDMTEYECPLEIQDLPTVSNAIF